MDHKTEIGAFPTVQLSECGPVFCGLEGSFKDSFKDKGSKFASLRDVAG